jgi:hypothetical protein
MLFYFQFYPTFSWFVYKIAKTFKKYVRHFLKHSLETDKQRKKENEILY